MMFFSFAMNTGEANEKSKECSKALELQTFIQLGSPTAPLYKFAGDNPHLFTTAQTIANISIKWVKFVFIQDDSGAHIYPVDPTKFPFHADLLAKHPQYSHLPIEAIQELGINSSERKVMFGTLYHSNGDLSFDLISRFFVPASDVQGVFHALQLSFPRTKKIVYKPRPDLLTDTLHHRAEFESRGIEIEEPLQQKKGTLTVYNGGFSVGRVRRIHAADVSMLVAQGEISKTDILVMDSIPEDLPPVAAVVSSTQTSPASHTVLLGKMLGIVVVSEEGAFDSALWRSLDGESVVIEVKERPGERESLRIIGPLTTEETMALTESNTVEPMTLGDIDLDFSQIERLSRFSKTDANKIGAKAANLAFIRENLGDNSIPPSAAIPFWFEHQYFVETGIGEKISRALSHIQNSTRTMTEISASLSEIQRLIDQTPVPASILQTVKEKIQEFFGSNVALHFRSSGFVEDLPNFNGAGLYSSATLRSRDLKAIESALREVWKSPYSIRAYMIRQMFHVPEEKVRMAILVHPEYPDQIGSGVTLFHQPKKKEAYAETYSFKGNKFLATNPEVGHVPEKATVKENSVIINSASTESLPGQVNFNTKTQLDLFRQLHTLATAWRSETGHIDFALDFEWQATGSQSNPQILIRQVREVPKPKQRQTAAKGLYITEKSVYFSTSLENRSTMTPFEISYTPSEILVGFKKNVFEISESGINDALESISFYGRSGDLISVHRNQFIIKYKIYSNILTAIIEIPETHSDGYPRFQITLPIGEIEGKTVLANFKRNESYIRIDNRSRSYPISEGWAYNPKRIRRIQQEMNSSMDELSLPIYLYPSGTTDREYYFYEEDDSLESFRYIAKSVSISGEDMTFGFDGTQYSSTMWATIKGLTKAGHIRFSAPKSMVCHTTRHNGIRERLFDVTLADNYKEHERELTALRIRYVIVNDSGTIFYTDSEGQLISF